MADDRLQVMKAGWEVPGDFECEKPEFAEYLDASASYDQRERMGRVYWVMKEDRVVGYIVLAMGSADKEQQPDLGIDAYGPIPALLIARLATDKRYKRKGVGRFMTSYAVRLAKNMASDVGCRVVLANSDPDAVGFYEKTGFVKFKIRAISDSAGIGDGSNKVHHTENGGGGADYVPMYFDIGQKPFHPESI